MINYLRVSHHSSAYFSVESVLANGLDDLDIDDLNIENIEVEHGVQVRKVAKSMRLSMSVMKRGSGVFIS